MGRKYFLARKREFDSGKTNSFNEGGQEGKVELNIYDGPSLRRMIKADAFHLKNWNGIGIMLSEDRRTQVELITADDVAGISSAVSSLSINIG